MSSSVESESQSTDGEQDSKPLGVRFAESTVGEPIIDGLLFIANSFWLILAAVGVLLVLVAIAMWEGALAGIVGVFGLSAIAVGLVGYVGVQIFIRRQETRS